MYKQYFKQAWNLIRQERLFSLIYIIGTGLSVSMVMVLSIVFYIKIANIYPETNRDRMLVAKSGKISYKDSQRRSSSSLSEEVINTCFAPLQGVEAIAVLERWGSPGSGSFNGDSYRNQRDTLHKGSGQIISFDPREDYFNVFRYTYPDGKPVSVHDFELADPKAMVIGHLAEAALFPNGKATGQVLESLREERATEQFEVKGVIGDIKRFGYERPQQAFYTPVRANADNIKYMEMALGSTGSDIRKLLLLEGICLLLVVTLPAMLIEAQFVYAGLIDTLGLYDDNVGYLPDRTVLRFILTNFLTWLLLAVALVTVIWLPATKAARMAPADALHYE